MPGFVGDRRERADLRGAGRGDGDAGQHAALRVLHFAADAAGRARAAALGEQPPTSASIMASAQLISAPTLHVCEPPVASGEQG